MKIAFPLLPCLVLSVLPSISQAQWVQTTGPNIGPVSTFSTNPADGHVFAVANESAFRSRDGGATWTPLFGGLPGNPALRAVGAGGSVIYLAGYLPTGPVVYRSTDDGDHWTQAGGAGLPLLASIIDFWIDGSTVLAGMDGGGIYRTTDGGDTWSASNSGIPAGTGIAVIEGAAANLYAGSSIASPTKGVFRSTDGGATWSATNATFLTGITSVVGLGVNASGAFAATNFSGVHRTTDQGASWQKINPDVATKGLMKNNLDIMACANRWCNSNPDEACGV